METLKNLGNAIYEFIAELLTWTVGLGLLLAGVARIVLSAIEELHHNFFHIFYIMFFVIVIMGAMGMKPFKK